MSISNTYSKFLAGLTLGVMSFMSLIGFSHGAATDDTATGWIDESFDLTVAAGIPSLADLLALFGSFGRVIGTAAYWLVNHIGATLLIFGVFLGAMLIIFFWIRRISRPKQGAAM